MDQRWDRTIRVKEIELKDLDNHSRRARSKLDPLRRGQIKEMVNFSSLTGSS